MLKRSLVNLLGVRRASVNEARGKLAAAVAAEVSAAAAEASATATIQEEVDAASEPDADDATVDALAVWLLAARTRQNLARERRLAAESATVRARAALAVARAAEAAVEKLIEAKDAEERLAAEQRVQAELSERVLTPHARNGR